MKQGFSLLEIVVVIAVLLIILAVIIVPLSSLRNRQALNSGTEELVGLINEARSRTISAVDGAKHGVHLTETEAELFQGDSYPGTIKQTLVISSALSLSTISLNGDGDDIIFEKLTGKTNHYGSLTLTLNSDPDQTRVILIEATGLAQISQ